MPFVTDPGGATFAPGDPPQGVCFAPDDNPDEVDPTWTRLDDPQGYRYADGYTITRGKANRIDKTGPGTAIVSFRDSDGTLDPTNTAGPFYGNLDPVKQAAIGLMNPFTGDWSTLFRGFVGTLDHALDMFTTSRGLDRPAWQLVDAFDRFANVILTPGNHGHTPDLTAFPNIVYNGAFTPDSPFYGTANDTPVHVDARIIKLLDDAGFPGTGNAFDLLRNVFSGNVQVQGIVYSRLDSLLQALEDACDAEFPGGVATHFMSKDGVYTFHGRYPRFLWATHPGYGINQWFVGGKAEAAADPDVVPLDGPLRFSRDPADVVSNSIVLPYGVTATDSGVVPAADTRSPLPYGYRSMNFEGLLTAAGHDDDGNTTSAIVETNKFADYFVGNYQDPKNRIGTLRFRSRGPEAVGAQALWDMFCRVELSDVVTLTTQHMGSGGFDEDWFVEQIRYQVGPARADMLDVTLELEVSPSSFFAYNPFGTVDQGDS